MAQIEIRLPKMGESVTEATITNWLKQVGDTVAMDEPLVEVATDKVDSEVPSEVSGTLVEKLFGKDDLVQVGQTIAIIETYARIKEFTRLVQKSVHSKDEQITAELLEKGTGVLNELLGPDLNTDETETSIEFNFAVMKLKHTIKRKK